MTQEDSKGQGSSHVFLWGLERRRQCNAALERGHAEPGVQRPAGPEMGLVGLGLLALAARAGVPEAGHEDLAGPPGSPENLQEEVVPRSHPPHTHSAHPDSPSYGGGSEGAHGPDVCEGAGALRLGAAAGHATLMSWETQVNENYDNKAFL